MTTKTTAKTLAIVATTASAEPTPKMVRGWFPNSRGEAIVAMMKTGLPYFRAVRRTRRYFAEGKLS